MSAMDDVIRLTRCPHGVPLDMSCSGCLTHHPVVGSIRWQDIKAAKGAPAEPSHAIVTEMADLGFAWAEAEAALEAAQADGLGGGFPLSVTANAPLTNDYVAAASMTEALGPTPAAALRRLASKLREREA